MSKIASNKREQYMELVFKKIEGQLTQKEEAEFQNWLNESDENLHLYQQMNALKKNGKEFTLYNKIKIEDAWEKVLKKAKNNNSSKRQIRFIGKTARIAASFILLIAAVFIINLILSKASSSTDSFGQPGSFQAFLNIDDLNEIKVSPEIKELAHVSKGILNNMQGELRYDLQEENSTIHEHVLNVPRGGEYKLVLEDGTKVWLNSETNLRYPSKFEGEQRLVYLEGEAFFEVMKDSGRPFIVSTNEMEIEVLGTSFNVSAYPSEEVYSTTLVEGKINVRELSGKSNILSSGDQYNLLLKQKQSTILKVETKFATDWKEGKYIFQNENLEDVLHQVSKWYSLEYEFLNNDLKSLKYTGTAYKNKPLKELLDAISFIRPIEFEIDNQKLLIKTK